MQLYLLAFSGGAFFDTLVSTTVFLRLAQFSPNHLIFFTMCTAVSTGLSALVAGILADNFKRILISRISLFFLLGVIVLTQLDITTWTVFFAGCFLGIYAGIENSVTRTILVEKAPPNERFRWAAEINIANISGLVIAIVLGLMRVPMVVTYISMFVAICAVIAIRFNTANPEIQDKVLSTNPPYRPLSLFFRFQTVKTILFFMVTYVFCQCFSTFFTHSLVDNLFGTSIENLLIYFLMTMFAITAVFLRLFPMCSRFVYAVSLFCLLLFVYSVSNTQVSPLVAAIIFGLSTGTSARLFYQNWIVEFCCTRYRCTFRGFMSLVTRCSIAGFVYVSQFYSTEEILNIAFILGVISLAVGLKYMPNSNGVTLEKVDARFNITSSKDKNVHSI